MYRYPDGTFKINAPSKVEFEGFFRDFSDLSKEQQDSIGYNDTVPIKREQFTIYETEWVKGDDLIYREQIINMTVDETAKLAYQNRSRIVEITDRLSQIDLATTRPMRAIIAGTGTDTDREYISNLEAEAVSLRKELSSLSIDE